MKNIVLKYGLISGFLLAAACSVVWLNMEKIDKSMGAVSMAIGFGSMILAFTAVYFGIRAYREQQNGAITFGRGLSVGLLIALITCAFYVVGWQIVYWNFMPDFADKYAAVTIAKMQAAGASAAEISTKKAEMEEFKVMYRNPVYNVGMTFMEIFPVGLIISVISAAILRRKPEAAAVPATA
ncbi:MAG TPA: DUF4199 domain-containing protein [Thermoanaerobaculia bacterium]